MMVAQDAQNGTQGLDRFGPSGGGNTLRPVCGCIIPVLRCALGLLEALVVQWLDDVRYCWVIPQGGAPAALIYSGSRVTRKVL